MPFGTDPNDMPIYNAQSRTGVSPVSNNTGGTPVLRFTPPDLPFADDDVFVGNGDAPIRGSKSFSHPAFGLKDAKEAKRFKVAHNSLLMELSKVLLKQKKGMKKQVM